MKKNSLILLFVVLILTYLPLTSLAVTDGPKWTLVPEVNEPTIVAIPYSPLTAVNIGGRDDFKILATIGNMAVAEVQGGNLQVDTADGFFGVFADAFPSAILEIENGLSHEGMEKIGVAENNYVRSDSVVLAEVMINELDREQPTFLMWEPDGVPGILRVFLFENYVLGQRSNYSYFNNDDGFLDVGAESLVVDVIREGQDMEISITVRQVSWADLFHRFEFTSPEAESMVRVWLTENGVVLDDDAVTLKAKN